ncbi:helix-turn-helix transcriptional regulator [Rhizobium sp. Rhizsp42]|uniref:helix-turn-helix transcriptional regulator n=1 Tax=Rhizobium sp. Rhizsp42 TaxID=3243034 RepID=UPI0039B0C66E
MSDPDNAMNDIASRFDFQHYLLLAGNDDGPRTVIATNWHPKLLSAYDRQSLIFRSRFVAELRGQLMPVVDLKGQMFERESGERASSLLEAARAIGIKETLGLRVIYSKHVIYTALLSAPKLPSVDLPAFMFDLIGAMSSFGRDGVGANPSPILTPRERECLRWIAAGKNSSEVGAILDISAHTVNSYMKNVISKLGVVNRAQAVGIAFDLSLI